METYREKYKDLVKRLNKAREEKGVYTFNSVLDAVAPELKIDESEDEKMRKELIRAFKSLNTLVVWNGIKRTDILAWLEKQGEHANFRNKIQIGDKVTRNEDGVLVNLSQLNRVAKTEEKQGEQKETLCDKCRKEQPSHSCQDITELGRCALEKQGEQKPIDAKNLETAISNILKVYSHIILHRSLTQDELNETDVYAAENTKKLLCFLEQKPAEWSEEDKMMLQYAIKHFEIQKRNSFEGGLRKKSMQEFIEWLKSLKDRFTWKPSVELIKVCKEVYADILSAKGFDLGTVNNELNRLEEELKKLKG